MHLGVFKKQITETIGLRMQFENSLFLILMNDVSISTDKTLKQIKAKHIFSLTIFSSHLSCDYKPNFGFIVTICIIIIT